jgi:hypothetical protein
MGHTVDVKLYGSWKAEGLSEGLSALSLEFSERGRHFRAASMKLQATLALISLAANLSAAEIPKIFAGLFQPDTPVKGQIGAVLPPPEIDKYVAKVEASARKDPKWFREFSSKTKPCAKESIHKPLP